MQEIRAVDLVLWMVMEIQLKVQIVITQYLKVQSALCNHFSKTTELKHEYVTYQYE